MSRSSQDAVLYKLVKAAFSLLLDNENRDENCEQLNLVSLVKKLDEHIDLLRTRDISNELLTSLTHLKSAVVKLRDCSSYLKKRKDETQSSVENFNQNQLPEGKNGLAMEENQEISNESQNQLYTSRHARLKIEVSYIKSKKEFEEAMKYFSESNVIAAKVFGNEKDRETKITATQVRVISKILGNLTNLRGAATECIQYIAELHGIFNIQKSPFPTWRRALSYVKLEKCVESEEMKGLDTTMHINTVLFRFIKNFITEQVTMLNWTTIQIARDVLRFQKIHHPLLGKQPPKTKKPDPFIYLMEEDEINSQVSAVNCNGEIFAKEMSTTDESSSPLGMVSKE